VNSLRENPSHAGKLLAIGARWLLGLILLLGLPRAQPAGAALSSAPCFFYYSPCCAALARGEK